MKIKYPEIGVCGLSCRLCPWFHSAGKSRCGGCKSKFRMAAGCLFITCAVKRKGIEFCWECSENTVCEKWKKRREFGKHHDSFKCYQKLEEDIAFIQKYGISRFVRTQKIREKLLKIILKEFNEGYSKSCFCIAATVLSVDELKKALAKARKDSVGLDLKSKSKVFHSILDDTAQKKNYLLKLRE